MAQKVLQINLKTLSFFFRVFLINFLLALSVSGHAVQTASDKTWEEMKTHFPISKDVRKKLQLKCIAVEIIRQLDEPFIGYDWEIELFENPSANAFVLANGKIAIFTGIYRVATNQDELAMLIGHEVAHVTREHSRETINRKILTGLGRSVIEVATNGQMAIMMELLAAYGLDLPFERGQEFEADQEGLRLMAAAGFNPLAGFDFFRNMEKEHNIGNLEFLSTHPLSKHRRKMLARNLQKPLDLYAKTGKKPRCRY